MQVHRPSDVFKTSDTATQNTDSQTCRLADTQIHKNIDTQTHRYRDTHIYHHENAQYAMYIRKRRH